MRVAIITDAHSNLPALEAALAAIGHDGCDFIFHTGDVMGIGPHPAEVLDRLLALPNARFLMGNHDAWFADGLPSPRPEWMTQSEERHQRWTHNQIDPALCPVVARWPYAVQEEWEGVRAVFCHYGRDPAGREGFARIILEPTRSDLDRVFADHDADVLFYGHHHPASDLNGRARYINPGSLGCHRWLARYVVLECSDGGFTVQQHAVPYDSARVLDDLERRVVPEREFITRTFFPS